jgi:hypothetical protein
MEVDRAFCPDERAQTASLHDQAHQTFGGGSYKLTTCTTPLDSKVRYKAGGTMAMTMGEMFGRITASVVDYVERWCKVTYKRSNGTPITILVTYQVVKTDPKQLYL